MSRVYEDDSFRERVCAWLRLNDIDPGSIPMEARASIANGVLTIQQKVRKDGRDQVDPADQDRILVRTVQFPVLVEPDAEVAEWLIPRCKECGR